MKLVERKEDGSEPGIHREIRKLLGTDEKERPIREASRQNNGDEFGGLPSLFRERTDSLKDRLRPGKKFIVALGIASIVMATGVAADLFYFINNSANDVRTTSITACQPPIEKIQEAEGFLAGKHINPDQVRLNTGAYARGLKAADPSLGPAIDVLDDVLICSALAEPKVDKLVGDRHLYDLLAGAGSIALGYTAFRLYVARRNVKYYL